MDVATSCATDPERRNEGVEAQHRVPELARLLEDAGVEVGVADPDGSPLERYAVESVSSGPFGAGDGEVMWLELANGLLVGLATPAPCAPQPLLAGAM
jgi:hypothetical protein